MKKLFISLIAFVVFSSTIYAASYSITISGTTYTPDLLTVNPGDQVTISASSVHPLVQVDKATWLADGNTPMSGGWGTKTSDYVFTATTDDTIYFVCSVHVSIGMKGKIIVHTSTGLNNLNYEQPGISLYPNPALDQCTLKLNLSEDSKISVKIYNYNGQSEKEITTEVNYTPGEYDVTFDISDLYPGTHILVITDNRQKYVRKLDVVK